MSDQEKYRARTCPLLIVWDQESDNEDGIAYELRPCGTPLYVVHESSLGVCVGSTDEDLNEPSNGETSHWKLMCESEHVLLSSSDPENAEQFRTAWLDELEAGLGPLP